jgi:hypothetical protein
MHGMDRYPAPDAGTPGVGPEGFGPDGGYALDDDVEIWEPVASDRYPRAGAATGPARLGRRVVSSFPGAIAGAFLVTALAFGAALRPTGTTGDGATGAGAGGAQPGVATVTDDAPDKDGDAAKDGDADNGDSPADPKPLTDTTEDGDKPDASDGADGGDSPPADVAGLSIALHLREGYVKIGWSPCDVDGFAYYKVIRSTDEPATWPLGSGDTLVAAIADPSAVMAADGGAPAGKTVFYRVIALAERDGSLVAACASASQAIAIPAPTPKPDPEPEPDPSDKPDAGTLGLSLSLKEGKPYVDWSECSGDFDLYKVVRSTDSTVTWPKGSGDSNVAAVGKDGKTAAWDGDAPTGKKLWYRVFCLRETGGDYAVVAATSAKAIVVPAAEPEPEPEPVVLGFEAGQTGEGVALHWEQCSSESFVFYKVIRAAHPNPSYLPGTDGSQVIAVIENGGVTSFTDTDVEAGQTWYYRVQSIGYMNGHKILLGQTPAIAVTVE